MFKIIHLRRFFSQCFVSRKLFLLFIAVSLFLTVFCFYLVPKVHAASNTNIPISQNNNTQLNVVGNNIISSNGQTYIPEGISVYGGLEDTDYMENTANIDAQIIAAAKYWHANTIRLQIAESNLFNNITPGKTYNNKFLRAIVNQVILAQSLHMAVVINDQTEFTSNTPNPSVMTVKFWKVMSQTFKNWPYIIFDLFNEPRLGGVISVHGKLASNNRPVFPGFPLYSKRLHPASQSTTAITWNVWKYGAQVNGVTYIGMQTLVNQIRGYGANNLIWVEGPNEARELPSNNYLIKGSNIVYSIHHPNLNNSSSWNQIGNISKITPVVDGEWAQYQSPWAECFSRAYTNTPLYLNYLHNHGVGIIAWSLQAGSLVKDKGYSIPSNLNTPSSPKIANDLKNPSKLSPNYDCGYEFGQGVGQLLQNYFSLYSVPIY